MAIDWSDLETSPSPVTFRATGIPARHPAEADLFARHAGIPGHDQHVLSRSHVLVIGAGGLGSWAALGLARSGVGALTIVDPDYVERSNGARQLVYASDVGEFKAVAVARNVVPHMVGGGSITAIPRSFTNGLFTTAKPFAAILVLVDNNRCRWDAARFARRYDRSAVFAMLSPDGMRLHGFLQGTHPTDPCLWCALPNLDPAAAMPCVSAIITSCLVAAGMSVFLTHRALMGWPEGVSAYQWREDDLTGALPMRTGQVRQRGGCHCCSVPTSGN